MNSLSSPEPVACAIIIERPPRAANSGGVATDIGGPMRDDDTTPRLSAETRRRMSESAKRRCTSEWREAHSLAVRLILDESQICMAYVAGDSTQEIADRYGVSRKAISNVLKRRQIPMRRAVKRNQWGEANANWRGDEATVQKMHRRLDRRFGTPQKCDVCGTTDKRRTYDWANTTGDYANLTDYVRMCRSCHWKHDHKADNFGGRQG